MFSGLQGFRPFLRPLSLSLRLLPTVLTLVVTDVSALTLAAIVSVMARLWLGGQFPPALYWQLWPVIAGLALVYGVAGLYQVGLGAVDELRRLCLATTAFYLGLSALIFFLQEGITFSRGIFLMAWLLSMVLVWLGRVSVRRLFAPKPWWGHPVLILGAGKTGALVIRALQRQPELGLKPVAVLDDDTSKLGTLEGVPVLGQLFLAPQVAWRLQVGHAIVAMPGVPRENLLKLLEHYGHTFPHLLMVPDLFGFASLWVSTRDLGGMLGLEIRQRLLLPGPRVAKAITDHGFTVLVGLAVLPVMVGIALLVWLDSPGPIFYGQQRLGKHGRLFTAWKFRSMVPNGDQVLARYFQTHPQAEKIWRCDRKLKHDPRITRVGRLLRRTSLDELPQLWNVLRGEMSLVGPRPIVAEEVQYYADKFELYQRVLPGITGLWQVSGRSDVTYAERVNLDTYYVRNWSVWLDFYILLRTIGVVLAGHGAY